ncbi:MAG: S66 peptidase family protein [Bacillota bacterium]
MIIKPKALCEGDRVAVVSPTSFGEEDAVRKAELRIRALGLEPVMYPTCYSRYGYLSAKDEERAKDLNNAFADDSIKGIFCLKGGYGTMRILKLLDYDMIRNNPKIFMGFSDITALHAAFNRICRMVTYHGPMAMSSYGKIKGDKVKFEAYTYDSLRKNIFTCEVPGTVENPAGEALDSLAGGKAEGEIIGGNLSMLAATLGSPYEVDVKGKILFIEDIGEPLFKVDKMLTSLALAGKLDDCAGLILGSWIDCNQGYTGSEEDTGFDLEEVFKQIFLPFKKPIITNFKAGHCFPQPTIAFGTHVIIDGDKKEIIFTESGNI